MAAFISLQIEAEAAPTSLRIMEKGKMLQNHQNLPPVLSGPLNSCPQVTVYKIMHMQQKKSQINIMISLTLRRTSSYHTQSLHSCYRDRSCYRGAGLTVMLAYCGTLCADS